MSANIEEVSLIFAKTFISNSSSKEEIKNKIRHYADSDECFNNLVFEIGCEAIAKQLTDDWEVDMSGNNSYLAKYGLNLKEWKIITDYPFFLQIENVKTGERKIINKYRKGYEKWNNQKHSQESRKK